MDIFPCSQLRFVASERLEMPLALKKTLSSSHLFSSIYFNDRLLFFKHRKYNLHL